MSTSRRDNKGTPPAKTVYSADGLPIGGPLPGGDVSTAEQEPPAASLSDQIRQRVMGGDQAPMFQEPDEAQGDTLLLSEEGLPVGGNLGASNFKILQKKKEPSALAPGTSSGVSPVPPGQDPSMAYFQIPRPATQQAAERANTQGIEPEIASDGKTKPLPQKKPGDAWRIPETRPMGISRYQESADYITNDIKSTMSGGVSNLPWPAQPGQPPSADDVVLSNMQAVNVSKVLNNPDNMAAYLKVRHKQNDDINDALRQERDVLMRSVGAQTGESFHANPEDLNRIAELNRQIKANDDKFVNLNLAAEDAAAMAVISQDLRNGKVPDPIETGKKIHKVTDTEYGDDTDVMATLESIFGPGGTGEPTEDQYKAIRQTSLSSDAKAKADAKLEYEKNNYKWYQTGAKGLMDYHSVAAGKAYEAALPVIQQINKLITAAEATTDKTVQHQLMSEVLRLRNTPEVQQYATEVGMQMESADLLNNAADNFPQVKRQLVRQAVNDNFAEMQKAKEIAMIKEEHGALPRLLNNWLVRAEPDDEQIKALAEKFNMPEEDIRKMADKSVRGFLGNKKRGVSMEGFLPGISESFDQALADMVQGTRRGLGVEGANLRNRMLTGRMENVAIKPQMNKLNDDLGQWNINPYSITNVMGTGIGQTSALAAPTLGLGAAFAPLVSEGTTAMKILDWTGTLAAGSAMSYEPAYREAAKMTDDESRRHWYARIIAFENAGPELAFLSPVEVVGKIGGVLGRPTKEQLFHDLKNMTGAGIGEGTKNLMIEGLKEGGLVIGQELGEEYLTNATTAVTNDAWSREQRLYYEKHGLTPPSAGENALQTFVMTSLQTLPLAVGAGIGKRNDLSGISKEALFEAGNESDEYRQRFKDLRDGGGMTQDVYDEKMKIINTMQPIVAAVNRMKGPRGRNLSTEEKTEIAAQQYRMAVNAAIAKETPLQAEKEEAEKDNKTAEVIQSTILYPGKPVNTEQMDPDQQAELYHTLDQRMQQTQEKIDVDEAMLPIYEFDAAGKQEVQDRIDENKSTLAGLQPLHAELTAKLFPEKAEAASYINNGQPVTKEQAQALIAAGDVGKLEVHNDQELADALVKSGGSYGEKEGTPPAELTPEDIQPQQEQIEPLGKNEYPNTDNGLIAYHSTSKEGLEKIKNEGFKVGIKPTGLTPNSISFFVERRPSEKFGETKIKTELPPLKLLNQEEKFGDLIDFVEKKMGKTATAQEINTYKNLKDFGGYDGIITKANGGTEIRVLNPEKIKEINELNFKPTEQPKENIQEQQPTAEVTVTRPAETGETTTAGGVTVTRPAIPAETLPSGDETKATKPTTEQEITAGAEPVTPEEKKPAATEPVKAGEAAKAKKPAAETELKVIRQESTKTEIYEGEDAQNNRQILKVYTTPDGKYLERDGDLIGGFTGDSEDEAKKHTNKLTLLRIDEKPAAAETPAPESAGITVIKPVTNDQVQVTTSPVTAPSKSTGRQSENEPLYEASPAERVKSQRAIVGKDADGKPLWQKFQEAPKWVSDRVNVISDNGVEVSGRWILAPRQSVTASHNTDFKSSPGYPVDGKGNNINTTDYSKDNNRKSVLSIAPNFGIPALQNAPVISTEGIVLSHNGTKLAADFADEAGTMTKYKGELNNRLGDDQSYGQLYGASKEDFARVAKGGTPMLFFMTEGGEYTPEYLQSFNTRQTKDFTPEETAQQLSRIKPADRQKVYDVIGKYDTMGKFYADEKAVEDVFDMLQNAGIITSFERPSKESKGRATPAGRQFIESLLTAGALSDNSIGALNTEGLRQYREKLVRALIDLAAINKHADYSLENTMDLAVRLLYTAHKDYKGDVEAFLRNGKFDFGQPEVSGEAILMATALQELTETDFSKFIKDYRTQVQKTVGGGTMFGQPDMPEKSAVLKALFIETVNNLKDLNDAQKEAIIKRATAGAVTPAKGPAEGQPPVKAPVEQPAEKPKAEVKKLLEDIGDTEHLLHIDGVDFYLRRNIDKSIQIERVFIPEKNRGKKLLVPALQKLIADADKNGVVLNTQISPDDNTEDNANRLRNTFMKLGFKPLEIDGEIYRNDLSREPKKALEKVQPAEEELPPPEPVGTTHRVMGINAEIRRTARIDNIDYRLYTQTDGPGGATEIFDVESGQMVSVKKYPTYEAAVKGYEEAVRVAKLPEAPPAPPAAGNRKIKEEFIDAINKESIEKFGDRYFPSIDNPDIVVLTAGEVEKMEDEKCKANQCETNVYKLVKENPEKYYPVRGYFINKNNFPVEHWWLYEIKTGKHLEITPAEDDPRVPKDYVKGYVGVINKDINDEIVESKKVFDVDFFKSGQRTQFRQIIAEELKSKEAPPAGPPSVKQVSLDKTVNKTVDDLMGLFMPEEETPPPAPPAAPPPKKETPKPKPKPPAKPAAKPNIPVEDARRQEQRQQLVNEIQALIERTIDLGNEAAAEPLMKQYDLVVTNRPFNQEDIFAASDIARKANEKSQPKPPVAQPPATPRREGNFNDLDTDYKVRDVPPNTAMAKQGYKYELTIGYPASLGENGNDSDGNFYKEFPSIEEIKRVARQTLEYNQEELQKAGNLTARDERILNAINKALGKKPTQPPAAPPVIPPAKPVMARPKQDPKLAGDAELDKLADDFFNDVMGDGINKMILPNSRPGTTNRMRERIRMRNAFNQHKGKIEELANSIPQDMKGPATSRALLQKLIDEGAFPMGSVMHILAQKMQGREIPVEWVSREAIRKYAGPDAFMFYSTPQHKIFLSQDLIDEMSQTNKAYALWGMLHEVVHGYTARAIDNPRNMREREFKREIESLWNEAKDLNIPGNYIEKYGLKNASEFVAEIGSNPDFADRIKNTRPGLFKRILNAIRRLFGYEPRTGDHIIGEALDALYQFTDYKNAQTKEDLPDYRNYFRTHRAIDPARLAKGVAMLQGFLNKGKTKFTDIVNDMLYRYGERAATPEFITSLSQAYAAHKAGLPRAERANYDSEDAVDDYIETTLPEYLKQLQDEVQNGGEEADISGGGPVGDQREDVTPITGGEPGEAAGAAEGQGADQQAGEGGGRIQPADAGINEGGPADEPVGGQGSTVAEGVRPVRAERGVNYVQPEENDPEQRASFPVIASYKANIAALQMMVKLQQEGRQATPEEQQVLAKYVGWGGLKAIRFDPYNSVPWTTEARQKQRPYVQEVYDLIKQLDPDGKLNYLHDAIESSENAHYTSFPVIRGVWDALEVAGLRGGNFLEPSAGIGNFFAAMPESVRKNASLTTIEKDQLTGRLLRYLYPRSDNHIGAFEETVLPTDYYDLAISNVPFGSTPIRDPKWDNKKDKRYRVARKRVHNYFFVRALDHVRPGGLQVFITSSGTLDARDAGVVRELLADKAEFLGAVRLANDVFQGNANTQVVTDVIVLRKYEKGEKPKDRQQEFIESAPATLKDRDDTEQQVPYSTYYQSHPANMLGQPVAGNFLRYGEPESFDLEPSFPITEMRGQLGDALKKIIPDGLFTKEQIRRNEEIKQRQAQYAQKTDNIRPGNLMITPDGKGAIFTGVVAIDPELDAKAEDLNIDPEDIRQDRITYYERQTLEKAGLSPDMWQIYETEPLPQNFGKDNYDKLPHIINIRDIERNLLDAELYDLPGQDEMRQELNKAYDDFRKKYGAINDPDNNGLLKREIDQHTIRALEVQDKTTRQWNKSDIFTQRTINAVKNVTSAESLQDAILVSGRELGYVNMDRVAQLLGKTPEVILAEEQHSENPLIFKTPGGDVVTKDEYLTGDVKTRLADAEKAAETDGTMAVNIRELKKVQPEDITGIDVWAPPQSRWIPQRYIESFLQSKVGNRARLAYDAKEDKFFVDIPGSTAESEVYNISSKDGGHYVVKRADWIWEKVLNNEDMTVKIKVGEGDDAQMKVDDDYTAAAEALKAQIRQEWDEYRVEDADRRRDIDQIYNELFNRVVVREHYDGSHLDLPGLMPWPLGFNLRPHQKDAIWRFVQTGGGIMDHMVGSGKTLTMVATAMEMRRLGLRRKPMIVGLKSQVPQLYQEAKRAYPLAKILFPRETDFQPKNRKRLLSQIATNDWDIIILAHSQFELLIQSPDIAEEVVKEMVAEIDDLMAAETDVKEMDNLLKKRDKLLQKAQDLRQKQKDEDVLRFDQLGVDQLFVDESQEFKNLEYSTKHKNVRGLGNPEGSKKAFNMLLASRYLQKRHGADKGVIFASGTPISNSMAELYLLYKFLTPASLIQWGIKSFDQWADVFAEASPGLEYYLGKFKNIVRFRKFANVPEMIKSYRTMADVRNSENLDIDRPNAVSQLVALKRTPTQERLFKMLEEFIATRGNMWREELGLTKGYREDKQMNPAYGVMATTYGRQLSLDPRLVDARLDEGGKIEAVSQNIKTIYDKSHYFKGTQLVFADDGTPKSPDRVVNLFAYLNDERGLDAEDMITIFGAGMVDGDDVKPPKWKDVKNRVMDVLSLTGEEADLLVKEANEANQFELYPALKKKLVEMGIPENEIAFIHSYNTRDQRMKLYADVNDGKIRVVIGSTSKMGVGVNVQKRAVAAHHLDIKWRPSDLEQRNGRIHRQGNEFAKSDWNNQVDIYFYATEQSLDPYMYELVGQKAKFINALKVGKVTDREMPEVDEEFDMSTIASILSGDPLFIKKEKLKKEVRRQDSARKAFANRKTRAQDNEAKTQRGVARDKARIKELTAINGIVQANQKKVIDENATAEEKEKHEKKVMVLKDKAIQLESQRFNLANEIYDLQKDQGEGMFDTNKPAIDEKQKEYGKIIKQIDNTASKLDSITEGVAFDPVVDGKTYETVGEFGEGVLEFLKEKRKTTPVGQEILMGHLWGMDLLITFKPDTKPGQVYVTFRIANSGNMQLQPSKLLASTHPASVGQAFKKPFMDIPGDIGVYERNIKEEEPKIAKYREQAQGSFAEQKQLEHNQRLLNAIEAEILNRGKQPEDYIAKTPEELESGLLGGAPVEQAAPVTEERPATTQTRRVRSQDLSGNLPHEAALFSPLQREKVPMKRSIPEKTTVRGALELVAADNNKFSGLAKHILETADKTSLNTPVEVGDLTGGRSVFEMRKAGDTVRIDRSDAANAVIILHEISHAATARKIPDRLRTASIQELRDYLKDEKADGNVKEMVRIYLKARDEISGDKYGFKNLDEFIAEGYSSPAFQQELVKVKDNRGRTLWQKFVNAVKGLLGIGTQGNLLESLMKAGAMIMATEQQSTQMEGDLHSQGSPQDKAANLRRIFEQAGDIVKQAKMGTYEARISEAVEFARREWEKLTQDEAGQKLYGTFPAGTLREYFSKPLQREIDQERNLKQKAQEKQQQQQPGGTWTPPPPPPSAPEIEAINGFELKNDGVVKKSLTYPTMKGVFDDHDLDTIPEMEYRSKILNTMLEQGLDLLGIFQDFVGSNDITVYGRQLYDYIRYGTKFVNDPLSPKMGIMMVTYLGELYRQEAIAREDNSPQLGQISALKNEMLSYYTGYMRARGQEIASIRMLRLFRDYYMADYFEDLILRDQELARKRRLEATVTTTRDKGRDEETQTTAFTKMTEEEVKKEQQEDKAAHDKAEKKKPGVVKKAVQAVTGTRSAGKAAQSDAAERAKAIEDRIKKRFGSVQDFTDDTARRTGEEEKPCK